MTAVEPLVHLHLVLLLYSCFLFSPSLTSLVSGSVASEMGFFNVSR